MSHPALRWIVVTACLRSWGQPQDLEWQAWGLEGAPRLTCETGLSCHCHDGGPAPSLAAASQKPSLSELWSSLPSPERLVEGFLLEIAAW